MRSVANCQLRKKICGKEGHTSSKQGSLGPIHGEQDSRPQAHALREVDATPKVDSQQATREVEAVYIKNGGVTDVRKRAEMPVLERLVGCFVKVTVIDLVHAHAGGGARNGVELARQVLALLMGALGRGRERGQLRVNLAQQLVQLAEVESAALVLVVLLEQLVETAQMVCRLREACPHALGDQPPVRVRDVHVLRVLALLPSKRTQEGYDVVRHVVLHGRAVADSVDIA